MSGRQQIATPERLGPYEVEAVLGSGGMGTVYRARDPRLRRRVAVKVIDGAPEGSARQLRFVREARLAGAVHHPNVLRVFDVGQDGERSWVVTELLEGETLRARLGRGALPGDVAVKVGVQVALGLAALHEHGIVHRDIKPENIFLTREGDVRILDLGLARRDAALEPPDVDAGSFSTLDGGVAGTAAYMSPEQVRRRSVDPRSDVFSLGIVLYEMLGRRRPFQEETAVETMTAILRSAAPPLGELAPDLPTALARVVARCLEKEPASRFHSAHDLALALEAAGSAPVRERRARRALAKSAVSASLLAGAAAALVLLWRGIAPAPGPAPSDWGWASKVEAVAAGHGGSAELVRYDRERGEFEPFLGGVAAEGVSFSADGEWAAWIALPERELWRGRTDGSERLRLTEPPLVAALPRWSPDGRTLAFTAHVEQRPWRLHLVSSDGGALEVLPPEQAADPSWSPDGGTLLFGGLSDERSGLYELDLASRRYRLLPGTLGLFSPRWSPDGRLLAALRLGSQELVVQQRGDREWRELVEGPVNYPVWIGGGQLFFGWSGRARERGTPPGLYRISAAGGRPVLVVSLEGVEVTGGDWGAWTGVTPDGSPLVLRRRPEPRVSRF